MISLRNRGKYPKAVREEFEHFASRLAVLLGQVLDEDGNVIDSDGNVVVSHEEGVSVESTTVHNESLAFGSTEETKTVNIQAFAGFDGADESEVWFELHGPKHVFDAANCLWEVSIDPTTFPLLTFNRTPMIRAQNATSIAHDAADLPVSSHAWSMWRRRSE